VKEIRDLIKIGKGLEVKLMARWKKFKSGIKYYVKARNVKTGKIVRLPITTKAEVKRMKWYPKNDYIPLKIVKKR